MFSALLRCQRSSDLRRRADLLIPPTKGDIAIIMKKCSLFKTAFSFLFFSVSCPGAFDPALELDVNALHAAPTLTLPDALEIKDLSSAPPQDLGLYFSLLPHEKMLDLISYLDAKSLLAFSQICKTIDDLVGHSAQDNLKQVTYDQFDPFHEPARLKKGALSALKSGGCSFLAPGTPLPQGARPLDSLESLAFFNQIFSTQKEGLIDADLMCLDAVCPLVPKDYSPATSLSKALVFLERNASKPSNMWTITSSLIAQTSKPLRQALSPRFTR
jgi:hypothetical protein